MDRQQLMALPEKQRRLILGREALEHGYGGITAIALKYSVSRTTVTKGRDEYLNGEQYKRGDRSRKEGGGRRPITVTHPKIEENIAAILENENSVYGDPMKKRRYTTLSERKISKFLLQDYNIKASYKTVGRILKKMDLADSKIKR